MLIEHVDDPDPATHDAIAAVIDAFNDGPTGRPEPARRFAAVVRDADGAVAGGALVTSYYDWAFVNMIALGDAARGRGGGTRVMRAVEREAVRHGCHGIWLDTSAYQAPVFYQKLGFVEFAHVRNHGSGWTKYWFRKSPLHEWPDQGVELVVDPGEDVRAAIRGPLVAHSEEKAGPSHPSSFALALRAEAGGPILGGLYARQSRGWLFVELLVLPAAARGQGLGTRLMRMAEDATRAQGGVGVWLDTFSFQARGFYERLGYRAFGALDDYPAPHRRFLLARRLDGAPLEASALDGTAALTEAALATASDHP